MTGHHAPPPRPALGGLVLAGGAGARFGRPKAAVSFGGRSLVARAAEALRPHCDPVIVVARSDTPLPADLPAWSRVVLDRQGPAAALAALATGLAALDNDDVLVLGCDLVVDPIVISRLARMLAGSAATVSAGGTVQPLCGRYPRLAAQDVAEALVAADDLRARQLVTNMGAEVIDVPADSCQNLNTWVDAYAVALGVPMMSPDLVDAVLDLTRIVAHGTERKNGPLASYLAGYAAGAAAADRSAIARSAAEELIDDSGPAT